MDFNILSRVDNILSIKTAVETINNLGIPKKDKLTYVFFKQFSKEWNVRRTLGNEEDFLKFIDNFNNDIYKDIERVDSLKNAAELVKNFSEDRAITIKNGERRRPLSAVSKIFHFYNPTHFYVYDRYASKALNYSGGVDGIYEFFKKFDDALKMNDEFIMKSISDYVEINGSTGLNNEDIEILKIRFLDVSLMKISGRNM